MTRDLKPFRHLGYEFRPCTGWTSLSGGDGRWYAVIHHHKTGLEMAEQYCPTFATKADCLDWAKDRRAQEAILADADPTW